MAIRFLQATSLLFSVPAGLALARGFRRLGWALLGITGISLVFHGPGRHSRLVKAADISFNHLVTAAYFAGKLAPGACPAWAFGAVAASIGYSAAVHYLWRLNRASDRWHASIHVAVAAACTTYVLAR